MASPLVVVSLVLAALALLGAVALYLARRKLELSHRQLTDKLVVLENRLAERSAANAPRTVSIEKRAPASTGTKPRREPDESAPKPELLSLRRDVAHLKEDLRRARDELKQRESELRTLRDEEEKRLFVLREENKRLVEQLKEVDAQAKQSIAQAQMLRNEAEAHLKRKEAELLQAARAATPPAAPVERPKAPPVADDGALRKLRDELDRAQTELRSWREASAAIGGKPLDPVLFLRWRDRALAGRKMYQMMRQLRELSDQKLETYQHAVEALAAELLRSRGMPVPAVRPGEVRSDALLALLWDKIPDLKGTPLLDEGRDVTESGSEGHTPSSVH